MKARSSMQGILNAVLGIALPVISFCTLLLVPSVCLGQAGSLDPTFGTGGLVTIDPPSNSADRTFSKANAVALQADGKIVAAGFAMDEETGFDFGLARFNPDGTVDATFGSGGLVYTDFDYDWDKAFSVALQADGKIVVAGQTEVSSLYNFAVARYLPDGSLDDTFGTGGLVNTDFAGNEFAYSVALQPDGKIVIAGQRGANFAVARYLPDGSLDATFGTEGLVNTDFISGRAHSLALQADGRIVAAGWTNDPNGGSYVVLARYNHDGSLDTAFGVDGLVNTRFSDLHDQADSVVLQADGKIVVAGYSGGWFTISDADFLLARYDHDGSLDYTFGTGGWVTTEFAGGSARAHSAVLQADGKIVVAGYDAEWTSGVVSFALARYNPDGSLDATFGVSGRVETDLAGLRGEVNSVALQGDGKIVVAGSAFRKFALARFLGDPLPPQSIESIIEHIHALVTTGALSKGRGRALNATLLAARKQVDRGNAQAATNQLKAFVRTVRAFVRGGILTASDAQQLIDGSQAVIGDLQEPSSRIAKAGLDEIHVAQALAAQVAEAYDLAQNYPNPFNPSTEIRLALPETGHVQLMVYDLMGREVVRLHDGPLAAGTHTLSWHADNVPSGAYVYRLTAGAFTATKIMMVLK